MLGLKQSGRLYSLTMASIRWQALSAELGLELTAPLRSVLRELIAEKGYEDALLCARQALAQIEDGRQARVAMGLRLQLAGVKVIDPDSTYIDGRSTLGRGTVVWPNTTISASHSGELCEIGPNSSLMRSRVGDRCRIFYSVIEESTLEGMVSVGPFSHVRARTHLEANVHVGNFAEVKRSRVGRGTRVGHFSYVGDAAVGAEVNVGAGTVTCNFDGRRKNKTVIGDGAFIGSDTMLVAPVEVGSGASTGAGSVVTKDVPAGALVVGVPGRQTRRARSRAARKVGPSG